MGLLRTSLVRACEPNPLDNIVHSFKQSKTKKLLRETKDAKGTIIMKSYVDVPFIEEIPHSELAHDGVTCDMFSLENLLQSGVSLAPVTKPLFSMSLDARASAVDYFNSSDVSSTLDSFVSPSNNE